MDTHIDDHDLGLSHDLTLITSRSFGRRTALKFAAGAGLATLGATAFGRIAGASGLTEIPEETAGPYPGDGPELARVRQRVQRRLEPPAGDRHRRRHQRLRGVVDGGHRCRRSRIQRIGRFNCRSAPELRQAMRR